MWIKALGPKGKQAAVLKSWLSDLFWVPQQWQNLINHNEICDAEEGTELRDFIMGSFPVNGQAALEIPLKDSLAGSPQMVA